MIDEIDLGSYSVEQLKTLVERAKTEIDRKEQNRVQEVRKQMQALAGSVGMSVQDILSFDRAKNKNVKAVGAVKFRNPANHDETWSGRGKRPQWLRQALAQGANLDDFAVAH